jgi:hypothetical protein
MKSNGKQVTKVTVSSSVGRKTSNRLRHDLLRRNHAISIFAARRPEDHIIIPAGVLSVDALSMMTRRKVREVEHYLVDVAPSPFLPRCKRLNDGMVGVVIVLCGVLVGRRVAASHVPA